MDVGGVSGGGFQPLQPDRTGKEVESRKELLGAGIKWLEKEMPTLPAKVQAELKPLLEQMEKLSNENPQTDAGVQKWANQVQGLMGLTTAGVKEAAMALPAGAREVFVESFNLALANAGH